MDVKQESFGLYEVNKSEPDVSGQTEGNYDCTSTKQQIMLNNVNNDHDDALVFDDSDDNFCEFKTERSQTRKSLSFCEIKEETFECKIEYPSQDSPTKNENDSVCEKTKLFSTIIKKEPDIPDAVDFGKFIQKQEVSENTQAKTESELLTTCFDLPTLKSESAEYSDNLVQPCSSKHARRTLKTLKIMPDVSKKTRRRYPCSVCQKDFPSSKSRSNHIDGHFGKGFVACEFCGRFMTKLNFFRHHFIHVVTHRSRKASLAIDDFSSIQTHLIHSNENTFKCNICLKRFKRKSNLRTHLIIHTNEKPFKCDICSKRFTQKSSLRTHLISHTNENPFKCDICSKGFVRKSILQQHLIIHTNEKPFKCDICNKGFNLKSNLQRHLITHTKEKPFKCDICSKEFSLKSNLQQHLKIHSNENPFKCDICTKEFNLKSNLQRHVIIHSKEKPFKCDICSKGFNDKFSFRKHLIHSNEKPFKCNICSKEFSQQYILRQHLIIHTNEKPFKCDICYKKFNLKSNLKKHLIIHSNERPFKCDICSKGYNSKSSLWNHLIIHSNEKSFECDICSIRFNKKSNLQRHLIIHTKEKPFKCEICSKEFNLKSNFQRHLKRAKCKTFKCNFFTNADFELNK